MNRNAILSLTTLFALLPLPALAEVCDKVRPSWDGTPVSALTEAVFILGSPASLVLLLATALVVRFRSSWGAVAVCVGWSMLVSAFTFFDPTGGLRTAAAAEGCIGSPSLFIAVACSLSVICILITGKPKDRDTPDLKA